MCVLETRTFFFFDFSPEYFAVYYNIIHTYTHIYNNNYVCSVSRSGQYGRRSKTRRERFVIVDIHLTDFRIRNANTIHNVFSDGIIIIIIAIRTKNVRVVPVFGVPPGRLLKYIRTSPRCARSVGMRGLLPKVRVVDSQKNTKRSISRNVFRPTVFRPGVLGIIRITTTCLLCILSR